MKKKEKLTDRQLEIIKASIGIISEKGIQHLTIKNLSKSIGISEPAIYRHFESKMEILISILNEFEKYIKSGNDLVNREDLNSIEKMELIFLNHFSRFTKDPAFAAVIFSEEIFRDDKRLSEKVYSIMSSNFAIMENIIKKGQENGEIRGDITKSQMTDIIMGSLRLIVKKWRLSDHSFKIDRYGMKLWESIKMLITDKV